MYEKLWILCTRSRSLLRSNITSPEPGKYHCQLGVICGILSSLDREVICTHLDRLCNGCQLEEIHNGFPQLLKACARC